MAGKVKAIPDGFHSVTPHIIVKGGVKAIEFYKKAFGAEEIMRMPGMSPDSVMHAELKIGNSIVMLADEFPQMGCLSPQSIGNTAVTIHLYVENADQAISKAVQAGAEVVMPATDMFWGDRYGQVKDPFGHKWSIATHIEDVSPEQCAERAAKAFSGGPGGCGGH